MSYLDDVEKELRQRLEELEVGREPDDFLRNVRSKLLESFKNGAAAERKRKQNKYKKSQASK